MALSHRFEPPVSGFNFENSTRNILLNNVLDERKTKTPKPLKTGTTIAGVVYKDGVVLGADTRATSSEVVADKMCAKIHYIAPNIYCCGAGTAADTEKTTELLSSNLTVFSMNSGRNPRVIMAAHILQDLLFRYQGMIGANLILGGVDCTGSYLYSVGPYGNMESVLYLAMGSGDLAAMGILEDRFKPNMELEEAKALVRNSIHSGIMSDLGSGNNIDMCVITTKGVDYIRPYHESEYNDRRQKKYKYKQGTTPVLTEKVVRLELELVHEKIQTMETA
ncbi:proteasome 20S subunit beta 13a [Trichomycterus rosablanca]|uniref:proteasome 20S subunit beta 13a n=1 Tax=Trichomycterus rosablanca TaxID=2290929 RepID=UPI002F34F4A7